MDVDPEDATDPGYATVPDDFCFRPSAEDANETQHNIPANEVETESDTNSVSSTQSRTGNMPEASAPPVPRTSCTCSKIDCLKRYCQCFAVTEFCSQSCSCANCHNTPDNAALIEAARARVKTISWNDNPFDQEQLAREGCNCRTGCRNNNCRCCKANLRCHNKCRCNRGRNGCDNS